MNISPDSVLELLISQHGCSVDVPLILPFIQPKVCLEASAAFAACKRVHPEMPYLIVRESYINSSCLVDGLPLNEIRLITEKSSSPSDLRDERNRRVEFSTPAFNLLNALEQIGYKVMPNDCLKQDLELQQLSIFQLLLLFGEVLDLGLL